MGQRIAEAIFIAESDAKLFAKEMNKVLAAAGASPLAKLGTPLCLDVEAGTEISVFKPKHPNMVATEPKIYNPFGFRDEDVIRAALAEIGEGITVIRNWAEPAMKSLPPEREFGLVTWLRIFPDSFRNQEYFLSVMAAAMPHLAEVGVMIASVVEEDMETRDVFAEAARLIPKEIPGMMAKLIELSPMASGSLFIVAGKNS